MRLEVVCIALLQDSRITFGSRVIEDHGLIEELKALNLLDGTFGSLGFIEDDESLAFCLQVAFGNQVNHVAIFRKDFCESVLELIDFNPFF